MSMSRFGFNGFVLLDRGNNLGIKTYYKHTHVTRK